MKSLCKLWTPVVKVLEIVKNGIHEGADVLTMRRNRRGRAYVQNQVRCGPNYVHAEIFRRDGSIEDLGLTRNLLTNIGRDVWAQAWGKIPAGNTVAADISTAIGATSITGTGSVWTASNLATPQLGCAGLRVVAAPHVTTNPVVFGNVVSNTSNVLTIDKWAKVDDTTGATPTSGDAFALIPGGVSSLRFMGLSTDAGAASAADTVLASEVTTNGGGRVLAAYAHTYGASTAVLSNTFTASGGITAIHKVGLFSALTSAGADPLIYETVLSADATLVSGDTLAITWTFTLSG